MEVTESPQKTIRQEDVKLVRIRTVLAEFWRDVRVSYRNPVEVRAGGKRIGWASLWSKPWPRKELMADLVFDYASPERLSIETESESLYARLDGVFSLREDPFEYVGVYYEYLDKYRISDVEVTALEISSLRSYSVQPRLGEVVL